MSYIISLELTLIPLSSSDDIYEVCYREGYSIGADSQLPVTIFCFGH